LASQKDRSLANRKESESDRPDVAREGSSTSIKVGRNNYWLMLLLCAA
jgi:hypothetical protein